MQCGIVTSSLILICCFIAIDLGVSECYMLVRSPERDSIGCVIGYTSIPVESSEIIRMACVMCSAHVHSGTYALFVLWEYKFL